MPATIKSTLRLGDDALAGSVAAGFGRYLGAAPGTAATRAGYPQLRR